MKRPPLADEHGWDEFVTWCSGVKFGFDPTTAMEEDVMPPWQIWSAGYEAGYAAANRDGEHKL